MKILQTQRLLLRKMSLADSDFILELLNTPKWHKYIGDYGIDTLEKASDYLRARVLPNYEKFGFGFYIIERLEDRVRIGNCGLAVREGLPTPDIGYSLLPQYEGQGYAFEAASATVEYAVNTHELEHISAITTVDNTRSRKLLNKLGMKFKKMTTLVGDNEELMLYGIDASKIKRGL